MENSSDTIGNRTRDLMACSAVRQPTAPPRCSKNIKIHEYSFSSLFVIRKHTEGHSDFNSGPRKCELPENILLVLDAQSTDQKNGDLT
jgi:hypothetical protein